MTSYSFHAGIAGFSDSDWRRVEAAAGRTLERLDDWDSAWNLVVALGISTAAHPAMAAAAEAGQSIRVQALTGAAYAAISARGQIGERRFRALYRPFADVLPADPEESAHSTAYDRIMARCPVVRAWH
ncbi:MAG: hypothetical protein M3Z98_01260 [Candidatus Dormibacteraeota bacterium]|nr:hypothetical protein [Candidatus Dormibacteraeota bacterium]